MPKAPRRTSVPRSVKSSSQLRNLRGWPTDRLAYRHKPNVGSWGHGTVMRWQIRPFKESPARLAVSCVTSLCVSIRLVVGRCREKLSLTFKKLVRHVLHSSGG